jgi:octaprenyl-diphosphate synthase
MWGFGLKMVGLAVGTSETKTEESSMTSIALNANNPVVGVQAPRDPSLDYVRELAAVTSTIQEPLRRVEMLIREQLSSRHSDVDSLLKYVAELGGKRLRPALVLLSARAQGNISEESIRCAAAVELVHTATLVHDDVLDNAMVRRHRPSLHCQSNVHDSILIGDWLFTQAYGLVNEGESTIPGRWIARASKEVCEGEIRQNVSANDLSLTIDDYLSMIGQKTGSLCAVSCALGAWSAGGDSKQCEAFHAFGWKLGTAFQVHDDCLDYWGAGSRLGKPIGGDFAAGKLTLPILRLLTICGERHRIQLKECLISKGTDAFEYVNDLLKRYRVSGDCREITQRLSQEAIDALRASCSSPAGHDLERLAVSAIERVA